MPQVGRAAGVDAQGGRRALPLHLDDRSLDRGEDPNVLAVRGEPARGAVHLQPVAGARQLDRLRRPDEAPGEVVEAD
ncbi:MAG: hypothetical protein MUF57_06135, partial [Gammaproteobacteria bacterium]|nr:hypothetical protein [Gammaproteobacteria bacterium]